MKLARTVLLKFEFLYLLGLLCPGPNPAILHCARLFPVISSPRKCNKAHDLANVP